MYNKSALKAYMAIDSNNLSSLDFERKWYESVIMIINRIQMDYYNLVETHIKLLEIISGLEWIRDNLQEHNNKNHLLVMKNLLNTIINIISNVTTDKDTSQLTGVLVSLRIILEPYSKASEQSAI